MTLVKVGQAWINPELLVAVLPKGKGCCMVMSSGLEINTIDASADQIASFIGKSVKTHD